MHGTRKINTHTGLAILLLAVIVAGQFLVPAHVYALGVGVPTANDPISDLSTLTSTQWILRYIVNPVARAVLRTVIVALTQQVVNWIAADGGTNVGFVGNLETQFKNELDARAGEFLQSLDIINFCGNIGAQLKLSLTVPRAGYRAQATCTLTNIVNNVDNFYRSFETGGWRAFISAGIQPQNNFDGSLLLAVDAKLQSEGRRARAFLDPLKRSSITGFKIPVKAGTECSPANPDDFMDPEGAKEPDNCVTKYEEKTPGTIIEGALKKATIDTGIDFGVNAKDFDEAIMAIVNALLTRVITASAGGGNGIFGTSGDSPRVSGAPIDFQETTTSQDLLRQKIDDTSYLAFGTYRAIGERLLAARRELADVIARLIAVQRELAIIRDQIALAQRELDAIRQQIALIDQQLAAIPPPTPEQQTELLRQKGDLQIQEAAKVRQLDDLRIQEGEKVRQETDLRTQELGIKREVAELLSKQITVVRLEEKLLVVRRSSYSAVLPDDITRLNAIIQETILPPLKDIADAMTATPSDTSTGDPKTDIFHVVQGERATMQMAVQLLDSINAEASSLLASQATSTAVVQAQQALPGQVTNLAQLRPKIVALIAKIQQTEEDIRNALTFSEVFSLSGTLTEQSIQQNDLNDQATRLLDAMYRIIDSAIGTPVVQPPLPSVPPEPEPSLTPPEPPPDEGGDE